MKQFKNTSEYVDMPEDIVAHLKLVTENAEGEFEWLLGGNVFLLENCEDLALIPVGDGNATNSVEPMEAVYPVGEYMFFYHLLSDEGGNGYYVPLAMYNQSILLKLICASSQDA